MQKPQFYKYEISIMLYLNPLNYLTLSQNKTIQIFTKTIINGKIVVTNLLALGSKLEVSSNSQNYGLYYYDNFYMLYIVEDGSLDIYSIESKLVQKKKVPYKPLSEDVMIKFLDRFGFFIDCKTKIALIRVPTYHIQEISVQADMIQMHQNLELLFYLSNSGKLSIVDLNAMRIMNEHYLNIGDQPQIDFQVYKSGSSLYIITLQKDFRLTIWTFDKPDIQQAQILPLQTLKLIWKYKERYQKLSNEIMNSSLIDFKLDFTKNYLILSCKQDNQTIHVFVMILNKQLAVDKCFIQATKVYKIEKVQSDQFLMIPIPQLLQAELLNSRKFSKDINLLQLTYRDDLMKEQKELTFLSLTRNTQQLQFYWIFSDTIYESQSLGQQFILSKQKEIIFQGTKILNNAKPIQAPVGFKDTKKLEEQINKEYEIEKQKFQQQEQQINTGVQLGGNPLNDALQVMEDKLIPQIREEQQKVEANILDQFVQSVSKNQLASQQQKRNLQVENQQNDDQQQKSPPQNNQNIQEKHVNLFDQMMQQQRQQTSSTNLELYQYIKSELLKDEIFMFAIKDKIEDQMKRENEKQGQKQSLKQQLGLLETQIESLMNDNLDQFTLTCETTINDTFSDQHFSDLIEQKLKELVTQNQVKESQIEKIVEQEFKRQIGSMYQQELEKLSYNCKQLFDKLYTYLQELSQSDDTKAQSLNSFIESVNQQFQKIAKGIQSILQNQRPDSDIMTRLENQVGNQNQQLEQRLQMVESLLQNLNLQFNKKAKVNDQQIKSILTQLTQMQMKLNGPAQLQNIQETLGQLILQFQYFIIADN
ncbi:hypothetical protein pb186bvf_003244 [Paramecium bursaria]